MTFPTTFWCGRGVVWQCQTDPRRYIADLAAYPVFAMVSQRMWTLLHHRYLYGTDLSDNHPDIVARLAACWQSVIMLDGCRLGHLAFDAISVGNQVLSRFASVRHPGGGWVDPSPSAPNTTFRNPISRWTRWLCGLSAGRRRLSFTTPRQWKPNACASCRTMRNQRGPKRIHTVSDGRRSGIWCYATSPTVFS